MKIKTTHQSTSIERNGYIATPEDITTLTRQLFTAADTITTGRTTYLRALVATTIQELGATPRTTAAKGRRAALGPEATVQHLAALDAVHTRFYDAVIAVATAVVTGPKADKAREINRRTNFARTSYSAVRLWVKTGHDITTLIVSQVTKRALLVERAVRPKSGLRLRRAVEVRSKAFMAAVLELAETDKAAALGELELLMGQLAAQAVALGSTAVTSPAKSAKEHRPYKTGGRVFVPVSETQIIRQQERPS